MRREATGNVVTLNVARLSKQPLRWETGLEPLVAGWVVQTDSANCCVTIEASTLQPPQKRLAARWKSRNFSRYAARR